MNKTKSRVKSRPYQLGGVKLSKREIHECLVKALLDPRVIAMVVAEQRRLYQGPHAAAA